MPIIFSEWFREDQNEFNENFFIEHLHWCNATLKAFLEAEGTNVDLKLSTKSTANFLSNVVSLLKTKASLENFEFYESKILEKVMPYVMCHIVSIDKSVVLALRSRFDSSFKPSKFSLIWVPTEEIMDAALMMLEKKNFEGAALFYSEFESDCNFCRMRKMKFTNNTEFMKVHKEFRKQKQSDQSKSQYAINSK